MPRRKRSARRTAAPSQTGTIILGTAILAVCLAIASVLAFFYFTRPERVTVSNETQCPVDGPSSKTIVLLDRSDILPALTETEIRTFLIDLAETRPKYGLLELRLLDTKTSGGIVKFSKCNPGDGSDLSELNSNPVLAKKRWTEGFRRPLEDALSNKNVSEAESSPIIETIQHIAVEQFTGRKSELAQNELIVISDMIQHSTNYSQYKGDIEFANFRELASYRRLKTNLHGASVTIKYLVRITSKIDTGKHIQFWQDWVVDSGGSSLNAEKLQGAG